MLVRVLEEVLGSATFDFYEECGKTHICARRAVVDSYPGNMLVSIAEHIGLDDAVPFRIGVR